MKKILDDALWVFGVMFLLLMIASFFTPIGSVINASRGYLLLFFLAYIIGKCILLKRRNSAK